MGAIGCNCRFIHGEERRGAADLGETLIAPMGFHCLGSGSNSQSDPTGKNVQKRHWVSVAGLYSRSAILMMRIAQF
jgi:hypothetical protein